jgi:phosphoglycolate phosphatase
MRYQLVIFDFDGTLADSFPWFSRVINDVADRFHFNRVAEHEVELLRTMDVHQLMQHLGVPAWKMPFIVRHMRKRKSRELDQTRLFDGIDRMLRRLHDAGIVLAVVSSNSETNIHAIFGPDNASLIRYYECGASLMGKSACFRRVLRRSGVSAAHAICIGDEIRDHEAAEKAGIAFGAVSWGYTAPDTLTARAPAMVFRSVNEIEGLSCRQARSVHPTATCPRGDHEPA